MSESSSSSDAFFEAAFDADYLHFYEPLLGPEVDDDEARLIHGLLELGEGERVLDAGCGHGRIANRLAANGSRVVGIDRSAVFLERARGEAAVLGLDVDYRRADLHELPATGDFDAIVHWFTSFGYDDDAGCKALLRRFHDALRPGGRLLLETLNLFQAAAEPESQVIKRVGHDVMLDEQQFDPTTCRLHVLRRVLRRDRPPREFAFDVRLFSVPELRDWLATAGFVEMEAFDGEGGAFDIDADRLVLVARRGDAPGSASS